LIFQTLIIKQGSTGLIKIVNLSNGNEAIVDLEAFELLTSVAQKYNREMCSEKEVELLTTLEECMDLKAINGSGNLTIRTGDFESLDIDLTNTCNLHCKHCYFFDGDKHSQKKAIDFDLLKRTIIEAEEMGLYKLKLCGGEPLTYYRIEELLCFLNTRSIGTTIVCNGLLLDKILGELDNSKLSFVISLDGFEHSHDYLRGAGTFVRTKSNIEKAIKAGFDVAINMVVYDQNVNDINEFSELVKGMGVSGLNIQVVRPVGQAAKNLIGNMVIDESFLREIHQNELQAQAEKIKIGKTFCTSCKTGLTIDFNHCVIACILMSDEPVGNLESESLKQIHERSLKENPLFNIEEQAECSSCELFNVVCAGGCRARAKRMTGSLYACDYWIPFLLNHPKFKESKRQPWEYLLI